ncbi:MAG: glycosyltransferase family 4 protein [Planctomycetota bacterium]
MAPAPLRIALVCHAYPPEDVYGIPLYVAGLAEALADRGHAVTVVAGSTGAARSETRSGVHIEWVSRSEGPRRSPALGALYTARHIARRLRALHRAAPFDVIETPNYRVPAIWAMLCGLGGRRPKFILRLSSPRALMQGPGYGAGLRLFERMERWLARHADGIVGNSTPNLENCRTVYRLPSTQPAQVILHCLPPGPVPERLAEPADGIPRVLYVGRMEERKGFDVLARAWPMVLAAAPDARLIAVGADFPCPHGPSFARWALASLPEAARASIDLRGFVSDAARETLYREATLLCAPSRYESFGLMLLEALRYGRPVVSCRVGGIPEVIQDGATGLLVPPDDPPALAAALIALLRDPARRETLGRAGVDDLNRRFTRERLAADSEAFYRDILARG